MHSLKNTFRSLPKKWYFWVCIITGIAIFMRMLPGLLNPAWGCDFGIYYGLTNTFTQTGALFNEYTGWGASYQYFPILYAITGITHWITGIDVVVLMPKVAPIFGGLSVLIFYFIAYELLHDRKKALLASMLLAVLPFHVYQTSHAAPLTLGHFFMMLALLCFIRYRKNIIYSIPLLLATMLLIMSHHLTTYFYLISLIFIVFTENLMVKNWTESIKKDTLYILTTSVLVFSYWILVAKPVFASFMHASIRIGGLSLGATALIAAFYLVFFALFGIIWFKRRFNFTVKEELTARQASLRVAATILVCITAMLVFTFIKMPWTNFAFTPISLLYALPLVLVFGFGVAGFRATWFIPNGGFIRGWLLAILLSLCYGLVTNSNTLFPDRHFEYLMVPLSIIAVYGIHAVFLTTKTTPDQKEQKTRFTFLQSPIFFQKIQWLQKRKSIFVGVVLFLVLANAASVYPAFRSLNAAEEIITYEDLAAIDWMQENLDANTSIIASDHRLSRMAEAVGFNTTHNEAYLLWTAENLSEYITELKGEGKNYSRITHVIIDDIMRYQVVHVGYGIIYYMTNASYDKFLAEPFELIYRNVTINDNMQEERWAEVFAVNWTWIEQQDFE